MTLLMNACCYGDILIVKALLDEGADVDADDNVGIYHHMVFNSWQGLQ